MASWSNPVMSSELDGPDYRRRSIQDNSCLQISDSPGQLQWLRA